MGVVFELDNYLNIHIIWHTGKWIDTRTHSIYLPLWLYLSLLLILALLLASLSIALIRSMFFWRRGG